MAVSRKKKFIIGGVALAVLSLIVIASIFASNKEQVEVTTQKIEPRKELRSTVTASGEVRPIQYINLTSEVQGRIEEIYVKEGDQVTKGQPLVRLDPTQLDSSKDAQYSTLQAALSDVQTARVQESSAINNVTQAQQVLLTAEAGVAAARQQVTVAQTEVDRTRTDVDRAQVDLASAQRELKRTTELVEAGVASRLEYDTAKDRVAQSEVAVRTANASLKTAKERLESQKIAVEEAKSRANQQRVSVRNAEIGVKNARTGVASSENRAQSQQALLRGQTTQRDKTLQRAELNGVVAEIPSKVGTFATAGLSTTPLLTIADMSAINIEVKVDETEIDSVAVGQEAKVKVDAFQNQEIKGKVSQKTPLAVGKSQTGGGLSNNINVQEAKEFRVVIRLEELPKEIQDGLRPGMSATATITTKTRNEVIAVPLQAIVEKQPEENAPPANAAPADKPKPVKGIFILEGNKVKFVPIETGITGESDIEILSGAQKDMEVITGPSKNLKTLKEGDTVKRKTFKPGENSNSK